MTQRRDKLVWIALISVALTGCGSRYDHSYIATSGSQTRIHPKHANKGYNKPYEINGILYTPQKHYELNEIGIASYYGGTDVFHGRPTSTGERFDMNEVSAAHKTLPLPCVVRVTNLENNRSIKVKVNDRGPFVGDRIIDVSRKVAQLLGFYQKGTAQVRVETALDDTFQLAENYNPHRPILLANEVTKGNKGFQEDNKILLAQAPEAQKRVTSQGKKIFKEELQKVVLAENKPQGTHLPSKRHRHHLNRLVQEVVEVNPVLQKVSHKALSPAKPVFIEAGLFSQYPNAYGIKERLLNSHQHPIKIETVHFSNQRLFRVLVGPFKSSQAAHYLLQQMVESGHKRARLVVL